MKLKTCLALLLIVSLSFKVQAQKYFRWVPTKQTICSTNQIQVGAGGNIKKVNINGSYSWSKQNCTQQESMNPQQVKIPQGIHYAKGREYYYNGNMFYLLNGTSCSATGISVGQFLKLLE